MASRSDEKIDAANPPEPGAVLIHVDAYERGGKPVSAYDYWRGANGENLGRVEYATPPVDDTVPTLSKKKHKKETSHTNAQTTALKNTIKRGSDNESNLDDDYHVTVSMDGHGTTITVHPSSAPSREAVYYEHDPAARYQFASELSFDSVDDMMAMAGEVDNYGAAGLYDNPELETREVYETLGDRHFDLCVNNDAFEYSQDYPMVDAAARQRANLYTDPELISVINDPDIPADPRSADWRQRAKAAASQDISGRTCVQLVHDEDVRVRVASRRYGIGNSVGGHALNDPAAEVRAAWVAATDPGVESRKRILNDPSPMVRSAYARTACRPPKRELAMLVRDYDPEVRKAVAHRPDLTEAQYKRLSRDGNPSVAGTARANGRNMWALRHGETMEPVGYNNR